MKGSDKAVVLGVLMAVLLVVFYLAVLAPKREKASQLGKDIDGLKAQVAQQEQTARFGEQARSHFPVYYGRLVVLGKAVPAQADTSSLLVELNGIAEHTNVQFRGISLDSSASGGATPAPSTPAPSASGTSTTPAPSGSDGSTGSSPSGSSTATATAATAAAPATEAGAANLPIGAAVGPAGLSTMPYNLVFRGTYFDVADFLKGLQDLIHLRGNATVAADGRLLTIDGFSLSQPHRNPDNPLLKVAVRVTSYVAPASEGSTAGASPSGPAPVATTPTQPASATVATP